MAKKSYKRSRSKKSSSKKYVGKVAKVYSSNKVSGMYRSSAGGYIEKKWTDITFTAGFIGSTAANAFTTPQGISTRLSMASIQQNASVNGRVGNKITVTNINWHGDVGSGVFPVAANTAAGYRVRLVLAWDLQSNGLDNNDSGAGGVRYSSMFASNTATGAAVCSMYRNMDTLARYKIIKDKFIELPFTGAGSSTVFTEGVKAFRFAWKGRMVVHYKSSTPSVVDLPSEELVLLAISDQGDGVAAGTGTFGPNITSVCRIKYIDC